jgi:Na+-translocating ferredoxin:NAD+ oxidoreductase RNF subunit RnfB
MSNIILLATLLLGTIGLTAAIILFFVSKTFYVYEDPRIGQVADKLPLANCGGCGYPGCKGLAEAIVKAGSMKGLVCPAGNDKTMADIAEVLDIEIVETIPHIAVLHCNGSCANAPTKAFYDSALSCTFAASIYAGESACPYGCLSCGDCVAVCKFDAIFMNSETKLPKINEYKCTGCSACVKVCPRNLIEIRKKDIYGRRVFVACANNEKGATAKKNCSVACLGCGICTKFCSAGAIKIENYLAKIDEAKCNLCYKCVNECPDYAIHAVVYSADDGRDEIMEVTEVLEISENE